MNKNDNSSNTNSSLEERRKRIRHSTAHVMADVVTRMFPEAKLAIGPPTNDGFYYDFLIPKPFTDEDLGIIEKKMAEVINSNFSFEYHEYTKKEIIDQNKHEPLKLEIIDEIPENEIISTYSHGTFEDLCAGPHVQSTKEIIAFKLLNVAGAYWKGDESRPMLQRIYGTAFESQDALDTHLNNLEEAKKRDHRKLGKELDLFSIDDQVGSGLIIWHPNGAIIRTLIEDMWKKEHYLSNYNIIFTPHVGKANLWETSGHLEFFKETMFPPIEMDNVDYYLKPMNCPFHIKYYQNDVRSYRDLPLRTSEIGTVYRYERAGVLHGLLRVRGLTQDDAHIFCRPDQVEEEINGVLDLTLKIMNKFGFSDFLIKLSTKPTKAVGEDEKWELATNSLKNTLEKRNIEYEIDEGGGAFYGPKIDIHIKDAIGRFWQCTTVQFDFNLPHRFGLTYIDDNGKENQPFMIHRALLGSLERFFGILIEHYAGAFPTWLAPIQAMIIPITEKHYEYCMEISKKLSTNNIRAQYDIRNERMNYKIRDAQHKKIPYMIIVGDKEINTKSGSLRKRTGENVGVLTIDEIQNIILEDSSQNNNT
jgi:threonyl-tRNA synthetase